MVAGWFVVLGIGLSYQEQLQGRMPTHQIKAQVQGIGQRLKSMVKAVPGEEDRNEEPGLGGLRM